MDRLNVIRVATAPHPKALTLFDSSRVSQSRRTRPPSGQTFDSILPMGLDRKMPAVHSRLGRGPRDHLLQAVACTLFAILGFGGPAYAARVVTVAPWELHSSFWMSLHQRLMDDATRAAPRSLTGISPREAKDWKASVDAYRAAGGRGDITFAKPMEITSDVLTQVADDASELVAEAPLREALVRAAPIYRAHGWQDDDRAARFFIGYAAAMLSDAGAELVRRHEAVYHVTWPKRIRVYITPVAGPYGAYTFKGIAAGGFITTMSCRDSGYQGLRALEMLLHESSHGVVGPNRGTVADAISKAAKAHGVAVPSGLWHAILFATSSELTRQALAERGVTDFVPSSEDLFTRVWPKYRKPIEEHWIAYVNGKGTLEKALDSVVAAIGK
jgi:hypothetical protein